MRKWSSPTLKEISKKIGCSHYCERCANAIGDVACSKSVYECLTHNFKYFKEKSSICKRLKTYYELSTNPQRYLTRNSPQPSNRIQ